MNFKKPSFILSPFLRTGWALPPPYSCCSFWQLGVSTNPWQFHSYLWGQWQINAGCCFSGAIHLLFKKRLSRWGGVCSVSWGHSLYQLFVPLWVLCLHVYVPHYVPGAWGGKRRDQITWNLSYWWSSVTTCVRNQSQVLCEGSKHCWLPSHFPNCTFMCFFEAQLFRLLLKALLWNLQRVLNNM